MSQILSTITVIGIDIGKNSFHVIGLDEHGAPALRQKWSRGQVEARLANMPPCLIGMEACVGAHHLSRKLKTLGHDARLMPAKYVRPYSKGQKNDFRDAEAIAEAVQRPTMKFVATKTAEQLDLQALHRVRERLVSQRTGIINQIRAFLLERGVAIRQGFRFLRAELPRILAAPPEVLSPRMVRIIGGLAEDWRRLDERIDCLSGEITDLARQAAGCERIFSEKASGKSTDGRPEFKKLLKALLPGDVVVVTNLDRLARSSRDLHNILHELEGLSCGFVSLGETWCDTTTDVGRLMLTIMGGIAEFERGLIRKRCEEGIERAKRKGTKFGRPQALDEGERRTIADRYAKGATIVELAAEYEVGAGTIWRSLQSGKEAAWQVSPTLAQ